MPSNRRKIRRQVARSARSAWKRTTQRRARPPSPGSLPTPYLSLVRSPALPMSTGDMGREIVVATYNVHRWTGLNGRKAPDPERAASVISELDADVIALQEVLRPIGSPDPLATLADGLGLHLAFAVTRVHKRGELGNAILSRWPVTGVSILDLSLTRLERRVAVMAHFNGADTDGRGRLSVIATHLALVDRTRQRQVEMLLGDPQFQSGATVLLGDMNAWRRCKATRALDRELAAHHNRAWPASFPSNRPLLALDRIYARGMRVIDVTAHASEGARRASDHLPVLARLEMAG